MTDFKISIPTYIKNIIFALSQHGFEAYVVGGCVRDSLLKREVNDWDLCTSAKPADIKIALSGFEVIETGIAHGTVTAVSDGHICEITTFRCEGNYTDHRHPDYVSFTSDISQDLMRRDFTVNAMAYSEERGLIDLFGGIDDLKKKIIRCVGAPAARFSEDALRIMRALRFAATLNFMIESETSIAIAELYPLLDHVANERISAELKRLLAAASAHEIISENKPVFDFIFKTDVAALPPFSQDYSISIAFLLKDTEKEEAIKLLRNLKFDNATIASVSFLLENKNARLDFEKKDAMRKLSAFGQDKLSLLSDFILLDKSLEYKALIRDLPVITIASLDINGNDLMQIGIPQGKKIREILSFLLNAVIEENCKNKRENLITYLKQLY